MFIRYYKAIVALFEAISERKAAPVSLLFAAIGQTLLFAFLIALFIAFAAFVIGAPVFSWKKLVSPIYQARADLIKTYTDRAQYLAEEEKLSRKAHIRTGIYAAVLALIYVPVAIPVVLYFVSLLFGV